MLKPTLIIFATSLSVFAQVKETAVKAVVEEEQQVKVKNFDQAAMQMLTAKRARARNADLKAAQQAVDTLGKEVMKGNMSYTLLTMYPAQKKRFTILEGSEAALLKKFKKHAQAIKDEGVVMTNYIAGAPSQIYYVGGKVKKGLVKKSYIFPTDYDFERLVVVPVQRNFTYVKQLDPKTKKPLKTVDYTYILAIYNEASQSWSFMKAPDKQTAVLQMNEIRNYFRTLPVTMAKKLPKKHHKIVTTP